MRLEKICRYIIYALVLFGFLLLSQQLLNEFQRMAGITYNVYPFIYASICCSILMGSLVGVDVILKEAQKGGKWGIDAEKLMFIGLPSFYFSFKSFIMLPVFSPALSSSFSLYVNPETAFISALIFGYSVTTSFHKKDLKK